MNAFVLNATTYTGNLNQLTRLITAAIIAFSVALIAIVAWTGWNANKVSVDAQRTLVENALNQSIERVLNEQKSVAFWDDSVVNIAAKNHEWVDSNFGIFLTETYGQSEIYIVDPQNKPTFAYIAGEPVEADAAFGARAKTLGPLLAELRSGKKSKLRHRPDTFSAGLANYSSVAPHEDARWQGHILPVDGKPAVVALITVVPNVDMSVLKGQPFVLLSVSYIDEAFIDGVGRTLLLSDLQLTPKRSESAGRFSEAFVADDGTPAGYLSWTPRRPGQSLLTVVLPLIVLAVGAVGWFSTMMLRRLKRASTHLAEREAQARFEAKHDPLSGLPNRHNFAEHLTQHLESRRSGSDRGIVVAYIDLDRFKDVNDTLGHHAGDALIRAVAHRLQDALGPQDFLSRFGGDEFAVLRASAGPSDAKDLTSVLLRAFDENFLILGQNITVTASVGVAVAPEHGDTTDQLMRHADIALYDAKDKGRDRAVLFTHDMAWQVEDRRAIELDLREAIDQDLLSLNWQPIVSSATGKTIAVEALLRWNHIDKGQISPAVFVPIAENAGLMPKLGAWVLDNALEQAARWPDLQVTINLSPVQFRHVDLESELPRALVRHKVDSRRVILEVTEGVLLEATDKTRQTLEALRRMGFQVALDDFGTGYSSLAYLSNFTFDKLKIDRSFVSGIGGQKKLKTIVQSVITIGRGLGMQVVAEGVETEAEAAMMRLFGCQELQGFYFSKPVDAAHIDARLRAEAAPDFTPTILRTGYAS